MRSLAKGHTQGKKSSISSEISRVELNRDLSMDETEQKTAMLNAYYQRRRVASVVHGTFGGNL